MWLTAERPYFHLPRSQLSNESGEPVVQQSLLVGISASVPGNAAGLAIAG